MKAAFTRARSPANKALRRRAILDAAAALLSAKGMEAVTFPAVAAGVGVVKSNLYRYFESREEILARLLVESLDEFAGTTAARLDAMETRDDFDATAAVVAAAFAERPRLCLLISALAMVLEKNVSEETMFEVKRDMMTTTQKIRSAGARACPSIPEAEWMIVGRMIFAFVAGLWPLSNPGEVARKVAERPEFAQFRMEFETGLRVAVALLLRGMAAQLRAEPSREPSRAPVA